jgi:hypothetical protein
MVRKAEGRQCHGAAVRDRRRRCNPPRGIGTIGIVDFDVVDFSNLQRQLLHGTPDVGRSKLASAKDRLNALNPNVHIETYETALTSANALKLFEPYDVILDGTDNFPTRYLVNDACVLTGKPNAYGSIFRFEGQAWCSRRRRWSVLSLPLSGRRRRGWKRAAPKAVLACCPASSG